ncbi:MAG: non-canonical purine NTP pyrophosphatase [Chloracidobacterium sp.]|nr:non-canonical purine NTP pyrophosphatase [Chloracidobacterium sp.]MCO5333461.1 non-canonical purine NTP pyrophosphatase [Pyrinomonadaceae bacterium]
MFKRLLLATGNKGKLTELRQFFGTEIEIIGLDTFPTIIEVEETSDTFQGNARLKAVGYARQTGELTLADDSGLSVKALGGRPGVMSARYGGDITFAERMSLLLDELGTDAADRSAQFECAMCVAAPDGSIMAEETGICSGTIAPKPVGIYGFGYDPVFIPTGFKDTFGVLDEDVKQKISHRADAFLKILPKIRSFCS